MPRIKIERLDSQSRAPGPVATPDGQSAGAFGFGSASGSALRDIGEGVKKFSDGVLERMEQSEVSALNSDFADAQADFTTQWQETLRTAKPGDNTIADKFLEDFDKHVERMQEGASTRAGQLYFAKASSEMRSQFAVTAQSAQAELAGQKARLDYTNTVSKLSSSLLDDPTLYGKNVQMHDDALGALVGTKAISPMLAAQLREKGMPDLAQSAVRGRIRVNPRAVEAELASGKWDNVISGDAKHTLYGEARQALSAQKTMADKSRLDQESAKAAAQNARQTEYLKKFYDGKLDIKDVLNDGLLDSFGSGSKQQFLNMAEERNKAGGAAKRDSGTVSRLFDQIHLPDGDPKKITDENQLNNYFGTGQGKGLDESALNFLRAEVQGKKTVEGANAAKLKVAMTDAAKDAIVKKDVFGLADPDGLSVYVEYLSDFTKEWQEKVAAGVPARSLVDPKSPEYMGNRFLPYKKNQAQIIQAMINRQQGQPSSVSPFGPQPRPLGTPAPTPGQQKRQRQAGESAAQYLKRTGQD